MELSEKIPERLLSVEEGIVAMRYALIAFLLLAGFTALTSAETCQQGCESSYQGFVGQQGVANADSYLVNKWYSADRYYSGGTVSSCPPRDFLLYDLPNWEGRYREINTRCASQVSNCSDTCANEDATCRTNCYDVLEQQCCYDGYVGLLDEWKAQCVAACGNATPTPSPSPSQCSGFTSCDPCTRAAGSLGGGCGWSKSQSKCLFGTARGAVDGSSADADWAWTADQCSLPTPTPTPAASPSPLPSADVDITIVIGGSPAPTPSPNLIMRCALHVMKFFNVQPTVETTTINIYIRDEDAPATVTFEDADHPEPDIIIDLSPGTQMEFESDTPFSQFSGQDGVQLSGGELHLSSEHSTCRGTINGGGDFIQGEGGQLSFSGTEGELSSNGVGGNATGAGVQLSYSPTPATFGGVRVRENAPVPYFALFFALPGGKIQVLSADEGSQHIDYNATLVNGGMRLRVTSGSVIVYDNETGGMTAVNSGQDVFLTASSLPAITPTVYASPGNATPGTTPSVSPSLLLNVSECTQSSDCPGVLMCKEGRCVEPQNLCSSSLILLAGVLLAGLFYSSFSKKK